MKKLNLILIILMTWQSLFSQNEKGWQMELLPIFSGEQLILEKEYGFEENEMSIDMLKFYISHIGLLNEEKIIWTETESYRLIDASDSSTLMIDLDIPDSLTFDAIQFQLGIDSATHELGILGGDLDPSKGMYWAWNTGYINFKIEGYSSGSNTRDKSFQYHLGGYLQPFETVQTISLEIPQKGKKVLKINLSKLLSSVDLANEPRAMSPGAKAKELSKVVSTIFYFDEQK